MKYTVLTAGTPVNVNAEPAGTKKLLVDATPLSEKYKPVDVESAAMVTLEDAAVKACDCAEPDSATHTLVVLASATPVGLTVDVIAPLLVTVPVTGKGAPDVTGTGGPLA